MNGTSRTSRKKKSKQQSRNGNCVNRGQSVISTLSKKQQAILNAPVKLGDEVLVTIHGIGSSGEGVGRSLCLAWRDRESIHQYGEKDLCYRTTIRNCFHCS